MLGMEVTGQPVCVCRRSDESLCSSFMAPTISGQSALRFGMTTAFRARRRAAPSLSGLSMWVTSTGSRSCPWVFGNTGNALCAEMILTQTRRLAVPFYGLDCCAWSPFQLSSGKSLPARILAWAVGFSESPHRRRQSCSSFICFVLRGSRLCAKDLQGSRPPRMRSAHFARRRWLPVQERGGPAPVATP
jgi:hypothetical protein